MTGINLIAETSFLQNQIRDNCMFAIPIDRHSVLEIVSSTVRVLKVETNAWSGLLSPGARLGFKPTSISGNRGGG